MTSTEALAAVQKAAEGQAASYAQTNTGKLLVSQVAVGEAMEKVGYTIMPALAEATLFLARVTTDLATVASNFEPVWVSLGKVHEDNLRRIRELNPEYKKVPTGLLKIDRAAYESTKQFKHMADSAQDVKREVRGMTKSLVENAETLISDFFDPIHDEWDRHDARVDLAAQLEELASAKTKKARVDSQRAIVDALEDESQALQDLGEQGDLTIDDVNRFAKDVTKAYDKMGKAIPADILKIIRALEALSRANAAGKESVGSSSKGPGNKVAASGGVAGGRTLVGERGPEVVDLPPGSFVHPTGQVKAGSSGSIVINITGADVSSPQRIRDVIARGMRVSQGNPWAADGPWGT
jgi:DNA repair ATPase RecN